MQINNIKIIIMAGGKYHKFKKHKALSVIHGEVLIERTIRLLKENGVKDISISSNLDEFDYLGIPILKHNNSYEALEDGTIKGYWLDAYYLIDDPCIYLHGDVYYTEEAIKKILNYKPIMNTFIGNEIARNPEHLNWGEPFGWIIVEPLKFKYDIQATKELQDKGKLERGYAISWELYRVMNGYDPNYMLINDDNYLVIDDNTIDVDEPEQIELVNKGLR